MSYYEIHVQCTAYIVRVSHNVRRTLYNYNELTVTMLIYIRYLYTKLICSFTLLWYIYYDIHQYCINEN